MNSGLGYLLAVLLVIPELWNGINADTEPLSDEFRNEFAKASWDFGLDLLKNGGSETEENVLLSPTSISVLLSILQQGAGSNTALQLEKTLGLSSEKSRTGNGHVIKSLEREKTNLKLEWANRAYVVSGFDLNQTFLTTIEENFNATVEELNMAELSPSEAAEKINDWVKEATHGNINDVIEGDLITADMVMLMINAIYFKSVWDSPFKKHKTRIDKFMVNETISVETPFMKQTGKFVAGEDLELGIKWTELPFQDGNFSMFFVLPIKAHGMSETLEKLTGSDVKKVIESSNVRRVKLTIPKFKIAKKVSLAETLKKLGLTDVFTEESDLRGISNGENPLHVSHLIHQANVEIDEEGSTAWAASTFEIVQTLSFDWNADEIDFRADHPFLFFIVDKLEGILIFAGKITNPKTPVPE